MSFSYSSDTSENFGNIWNVVKGSAQIIGKKMSKRGIIKRSRLFEYHKRSMKT